MKSRLLYRGIVLIASLICVSGAQGTVISLSGSADLWDVRGNISFTASQLGLTAGDDIDAMSAGAYGNCCLHFSVDEVSQGQLATDVNERYLLEDAESFLYQTAPLGNSHTLQNPPYILFPFLDSDINAAFLQPVETTYNQTLFFSLTAGSTSLQTGGILAGFSPGDIFETSIGASTAPTLHTSHTFFGLSATDDIDAMNLLIDIDDLIIANDFSLTAGNSLSASAADILRVTNPTNSTLHIAGIDSAFSYGLLPSDNVNALGLLFIDIPRPVPVPATVWLFGLGLLGLIGIAKKRKA
jgi:hypothetical protein